MPKLTVGLTGGLASGKTTVVRMLRRRGFPVLEADDISREIFRPGESAFRKVYARFGKDILNPAGEIDRKKLGSIVFKNPRARRALERLTHPEILRRMRSWMRRSPGPILFVSASLIYEASLEKTFDLVGVVYALKKQCIERSLVRNHSSRGEILSCLKAQMPLELKIQRCDFTIDNTGKPKNLTRQLDALLKTLNLMVHSPQ